MVKVKNMNAAEFEKSLQRKKAVCFCAGQGLRELCEVYPAVPGRISYIVDNYCYGRSIELGSCEIPVISMQEVKEDIRHALLVVASIRYADEIIKQLDTFAVCDGLEVFVPALFQEGAGRIEFPKESREMLPRSIHYCWFGKGPMPYRFEQNIETWKRNCPDYEIIRWDESNYDYTKNSYMKQAYEAEKWGFVPDYARLDIINTYGGIYLDTDIELRKSLDDFLRFKLFCGFENAWFVNFGLGFGGAADNPILQEMMDLYDVTDFIKPDKTWNLTASPVYQTKILAKHGLIRNGSCQSREEFTVLSTEYFSPINAYGIGNITANTYSVHQYAATWFGEKEKAIRERTAESIKYVLERL